MASTVKCQSCGCTLPRTIKLCPSCGGKSFSSDDGQPIQGSQPTPLATPAPIQSQPIYSPQSAGQHRVAPTTKRWGLASICAFLGFLSMLGGTSGATYAAFWLYMAYLSYKNDILSLYQWVKWVLILNLAIGAGFALFADQDTLRLMGFISVGEFALAMGIPALIKMALLAYLSSQLKPPQNNPWQP